MDCETIKDLQKIVEYLDNIITRLAQKCVPISPSGGTGGYEDTGGYVGPVGPTDPVEEEIVANAIYVSPSGSDSGTGTITSPYLTPAKAWSMSSAGSTIYLRGGTYNVTSTIYLTNKSGTAGNLISILNYPGESPVFNYGGQSYNQQIYGIRIDNVDYLHMRGIRVTDIWTSGNYSMYGMILWNDVTNCTFENIETDNIHGWGQVVGSNCNTITFLNCDSHHNSDPYSTGDPWGGSDGFNCAQPTSTNITYTGCRAWWNSDDGWDVRGCGGYVEWNNCWAFFNGYEPGTFTLRGNGIGFKLAGNYTPANHATVLRVANNCVAVHNAMNGIDSQYDYATDYMGMHIYNCTAYNNDYVGIRFEHFIGGGEVLRNNLSFDNGSMDSQLDAAVDDAYNSWNNPPNVTVTSGDFKDLTEGNLDNARNSDGSLPTLILLHLTPTSDLINAGTNVGLPYNGAAPDLGAFES